MRLAKPPRLPPLQQAKLATGEQGGDPMDVEGGAIYSQ